MNQLYQIKRTTKVKEMEGTSKNVHLSFKTSFKSDIIIENIVLYLRGKENRYRPHLKDRHLKNSSHGNKKEQQVMI